MMTVTGFLSLQQTFSRHSADRSVAVSLVRLDGRNRPAILELIRGHHHISDSQFLRLGRA
jgi:hypothetical protein